MESIAVGAFYALLVAFVLYKMTPEECKKLESKEPQGLFLTMAALSLYGLNLGLASAARMVCVVWAVPDRIASTHVGVYKLPAQTGCDNPMVGSGGGPPICFAAADK